MEHQRLSWGDVLERMKRPSTWSVGSSTSTSNAGAPLSWFGGATFTQAVDMLAHGWPEGRAMIKDGLSAMAHATVRVDTIHMDVAGFRPHVPMAVAGEPACMFNHGASDVPRNAYRLVISNGVRSGISPKSFINRGVALCGVVDALETAGHRVEIIADTSAKQDSEVWSLSYTVKELAQPLELDRVAFVFAHPAAHRRINFHMREHDTLESRWSDMGATLDPSEADHTDAIIVPYLARNEDFKTLDGSLSYMIALLKARGIEIDAPT